jgi:hypothetical protein
VKWPLKFQRQFREDIFNVWTQRKGPWSRIIWLGSWWELGRSASKRKQIVLWIKQALFRMREILQETRDKIITTNFTIFTFFLLLLRCLDPLVFNWTWLSNLYCFFLYLSVFPVHILEVRILFSLFISVLITFLFKRCIFYFSVQTAGMPTVLQSVAHNLY